MIAEVLEVISPRPVVTLLEVFKGITLVSPGAGGGAVSSVFGRVGAVVAVATDYTPGFIGAEPALGNPTTNGYVLSSTTAGTRSWIAPPSAPVSSVFGRTGAVVAVATDYTPAFIGAEPALGSPASNGQVLASTTAGVRSWTSLPTVPTIAHTTDFLAGDGAGNAVDSGKVVPTGAVVGTTDTQTVSNKRVTKRLGTVTSSATPAINTDTVDEFTITALATPITSMTSSLTGTPTEGQILLIWFKDNGTAQGITWGASFRASSDLALPTTTNAGKYLYTLFIWNATLSQWVLLALLNNI
jgi:hypothetical protein